MQAQTSHCPEPGGPIKSSSILASESAKGQALMTSMGQTLEEKVATHSGCHALNLNEHKQEPQASVQYVGVSATTGLPSTQSKG